MKELTKKQRDILLYLKKFTAENGYQPTRDQIGKKFGITGVSITHHMKAMEKKKYIKRMGRCSIKFLKEID